MARVTVEDCLARIHNPFELIVLAAQRARDLGRGESLCVPRDDDKNTVVALRELAAGHLDTRVLAEDAGNRVAGLDRDPLAVVEFEDIEPLDLTALDDIADQDADIDLAEDSGEES